MAGGADQPGGINSGGGGRGFQFHHTGEEYLMLTTRLSESALIPPYASHYIGAGGICLNDNNDLLVVRERYGFAGRAPQLKLPGALYVRGNTWRRRWSGKSSKKPGCRRSSTPWCAFATGTATGMASQTFTSYAGCGHSVQKSRCRKTKSRNACGSRVEEFLSAESIGDFTKSIVLAGLQSPGMVTVDTPGFPRTRPGSFS